MRRARIGGLLAACGLVAAAVAQPAPDPDVAFAVAGEDGVIRVTARVPAYPDCPGIDAELSAAIGGDQVCVVVQLPEAVNCDETAPRAVQVVLRGVPAGTYTVTLDVLTLRDFGVIRAEPQRTLRIEVPADSAESAAAMSAGSVWDADAGWLPLPVGPALACPPEDPGPPGPPGTVLWGD